MGHTVEDIKVGLKILLHERVNLYDPYVPPCPFKEELYQNALNGKIKIGYFDSLDMLPATSAMVRAINIGKDALRDQGFELVAVNFTKEDIKEARDIFVGLLINYMLGPMINLLENNYESPMDSYKLSVLFFKSNFITRNLILTLLKVTGNSRIAESV